MGWVSLHRVLTPAASMVHSKDYSNHLKQRNVRLTSNKVLEEILPFVSSLDSSEVFLFLPGASTLIRLLLVGNGIALAPSSRLFTTGPAFFLLCDGVPGLTVELEPFTTACPSLPTTDLISTF